MKDILEATLEAGGATFYADTLQMVHHDAGFYIGGAASTVVIPESEFTLETLSLAISDVSGRTRYIGTWIHAGSVYVDAVTYLRDAKQALELARQRGELAVYDIAGGSELSV